MDLFQKVNYKFYTLEHIDAGEAQQILTEILQTYVTTDKAGKAGNAGLKLIAIERLNTILAISPKLFFFEKVEDLLLELDVPSEEADPRIYVYFVKNGEAEDLGSLMNQVFSTSSYQKETAGSSKKETEDTSPLPRNPFSKKGATTKETKGTKEKGIKKGNGDTSKPGTLKGEINITVDKIRNALIIEAVPSDYRLIENILCRIDIMPRQVLIEVVIAEITLDDTFKLGVDWGYDEDDQWWDGEKIVDGARNRANLVNIGGIGKDLLQGTLSSLGLDFKVGISDRVRADIAALSDKGKVNILSRPHILASDNKEASIDVSEEIPVSSTEIVYTTDNPLTETSIEYRDTGIMLSVTPHINERGLVTMEINQEVSERSIDVTIADKKYPSFKKRIVDTCLTVKHGQTIVIGGLIRESKEDLMGGTPWLVDIPVLRYLFGKKTKKTKKVELIILITPQVIASLEDVDAVTEEFKSKVGQTIKEIGL